MTALFPDDIKKLKTNFDRSHATFGQSLRGSRYPSTRAVFRTNESILTVRGHLPGSWRGSPSSADSTRLGSFDSSLALKLEKIPQGGSHVRCSTSFAASTIDYFFFKSKPVAQPSIVQMCLSKLCAGCDACYMELLKELMRRRDPSTPEIDPEVPQYGYYIILKSGVNGQMRFFC